MSLSPVSPLLLCPLSLHQVRASRSLTAQICTPGDGGAQEEEPQERRNPWGAETVLGAGTHLRTIMGVPPSCSQVSAVSRRRHLRQDLA